MSIATRPARRPTRSPWNKGRIVGQKRPLLPKHVWSIRVRLEMADNKRDLALFNMAIDCKLRGCDLVRLKVNDVYAAGRVKDRASVTQSKTRKPVRFEITETTRLSVERWIKVPEMIGRENFFGLAVSMPARTCRRASMRGSCATGFSRSDWNRAPMARIRCDARRLPRFTR